MESPQALSAFIEIAKALTVSNIGSATDNAGPTEPTTVFAYMRWRDTSTGFLKIRNAANTAWEIFGQCGEMKEISSPTAWAGWLKRNGTSLSRTTYANLFAQLGTRYNKQFTADAATDVCTCTAHPFATAAAVDVWSDNTLPGGLATGTTYYVRSLSADTLSLHPTAADATNNTNKINITSAGTSFHTIAPIATFMLMDDRGEFLRCFDDGKGIDLGRALGSWQADDLKPHTHHVAFEGLTTLDPANTGTNSTQYNTLGGGGAGSSSDAAGSIETRPRNRAYLPIIKY